MNAPLRIQVPVPAIPSLQPEEQQVFSQLLIRKSMPQFEIAGVTGIYGPILFSAIEALKEKHLVTVAPSGSATDNIVTISGRYF